MIIQFSICLLNHILNPTQEKLLDPLLVAGPHFAVFHSKFPTRTQQLLYAPPGLILKQVIFTHSFYTVRSIATANWSNIFLMEYTVFSVVWAECVNINYTIVAIEKFWCWKGKNVSYSEIKVFQLIQYAVRMLHIALCDLSVLVEIFLVMS
jgi:hypothetical protein